MAELFAWKFLVPGDRWYPDEDDHSRQYMGCSVVVVAADATTARVIATRYMSQNGHDIGWLKVAKVSQIPLMDGAVLAYAEV